MEILNSTRNGFIPLLFAAIFGFGILQSLSIPLPVVFDGDCDLHTILSNSSNELSENGENSSISHPQIKWGGRPMTTHTIRNAATLSDNIDYDYEEADLDKQFQVSSKYFRYGAKWRDPCQVFLLLTNGLEETAEAIYRSGHGASPTATFFIRVSKVEAEDELISGFGTELFDTNLEPFHASILFFDGSSKIGAFCYFCGMPAERLQPYSGADPHQALSSLKGFSDSLNSHGFGQRAILGLFPSKVDIPNHCIAPDIANSRKKYAKALEDTVVIGAVVFSLLQTPLNITLVKETDVDSGDRSRLRWSLHFRMGEWATMTYPNQYSNSRASIAMIDEQRVIFVLCKEWADMGRYGLDLDYSLSSVLNPAIVGCMLGICVAYGLLTQKYFLGLDLLHHLFGQSLSCYSHPRRWLSLFLASVALLTAIYQAYISTEGIQPVEFQSVPHLVKAEGHKIFLRKKGMTHSTAEAFFGAVSPSIVNAMEDAFGGKKLTDVLDYETKYVDHNVAQYVPQLSKRKSMLADAYSSVMVSELRGIQTFRETHVCKMFDFQEAFNLPINFLVDVRLWSYLGNRATALNNRFVEMGIYQVGYSRLALLFKTRYFAGFQSTEGNVLGEWMATPLRSALGLAWAYMAGALLLISLVWIVQLWWMRRPKKVRKGPRPPRTIKARLDGRFRRFGLGGGRAGVGRRKNLAWGRNSFWSNPALKHN